MQACGFQDFMYFISCSTKCHQSILHQYMQNILLFKLCQMQHSVLMHFSLSGLYIAIFLSINISSLFEIFNNSGFLLTHNYLNNKEVTKKLHQSSLMSILRFIGVKLLHRLVRILPLYFVVMLFTVNISSYLRLVK